MKAAKGRLAWLIVLTLALVLMAPNSAGAKSTFGRIVVFGTSLSDPGNAFAFTKSALTPPYESLDLFLVPDRPYAKGGHHFSNGSTWIEQYAKGSGLAGNTGAALQGSGAASNYAVGGARAYADGLNFNLSAQVGAFLNDFGGRAPSDALYVIEMGGNDIRDALVAGPSGAGTIIEGALTAIGENIVALYYAGARRFLVWNAPDIGQTPAIRILDTLLPGAAAGASALTMLFNANLDPLLAGLSTLPEIQIVKLDVFQILSDIASDPAAFGLEDVETACIMPNVPPFECKHADEYLFWDGIHPTKAVHAVVAQRAASLLSLK